MQSGLSQAQVERLVKASEKIKQQISDKEIKKVIFVFDKLINIVI
jgi:leucyl-tRNA synthetase